MSIVHRLTHLFLRPSPVLAGWLSEWQRLSDAGQHDAAASLMRKVQASLEDRFGPCSEEVGAALLLLMRSLQEAGRGGTLEFREIVGRAISVEEVCSGPDALIVAMHLQALAWSLSEANEYSVARPHLVRRLHIWEHAGSDEGMIADCLYDLSLVDFRLGDFASAERLIERSIAIKERSKGGGQRGTVGHLEALAHILWKRGCYDRLLPTCSRIIELQEAEFGSRSNELALSLFKLASWLEDLPGADLELPKAWYARALTIISEKPPQELPTELADLLGSNGSMSGSS